MANKVLVEDTGTIRLLRLNRPNIHNCVDDETAAALARAIIEFSEREDLRVLVVTGAGETAFCSGADLRSPDGLRGHEFADIAGPMGFARLDPGKPTIAAVNGYCFAGGMELAAWCDFRIASQNAEFGALNRRWGVPFVDGGTQRFARIAGLGLALYLMETGVRIGADKAFELGLVQEVVKKGKAVERALELAERIAEYPQASLRADRRAALEGFGLDLDEGLLLERELGYASLNDPELVEGLDRFRRGDRPDAPSG